MTVSRSTHFSHRRLAWLLWLVFLLPLGQMAATWHMLSHVHSGQTDEGEGRQGIHADHCDLCPTAAALIAGAPAAAAPMLPRLIVFNVAPLVTLHGSVWSALALAYNSRAPPISLR